MPEDARMGLTLNQLQSGGIGGAAPNRTSPSPNTRIQVDVNRVREITSSVRLVTQTIISYAHSLGYYEPPKADNPSVEPVITTMGDAITDLERATNELVGSLNLFN